MGNREVELTGGEGAQGDEVFGGAAAAGLAFDGGEDAVEAFEGVGGATHPVAADAVQMAGDHVGIFAQGGEERAQVVAGDPVDPATPGAEFTSRELRIGEEIDLLQGQAHLIRLYRGEIAREQARIVRRLFSVWFAGFFKSTHLLAFKVMASAWSTGWRPAWRLSSTA